METTQSVAEARDNLAELVDRALAGEVVVLTRQGKPVVELRPIEQAARPVTAVDLEWLAAHRVSGSVPDEDAGTLVSRMRDEDWR